MSPAYDVTFSYRKDSVWVNAHQMFINGKSDATKCIEQVRASVSKWEDFVRQADLSGNNIRRIQNVLEI